MNNHKTIADHQSVAPTQGIQGTLGLSQYSYSMMDSGMCASNPEMNVGHEGASDRDGSGHQRSSNPSIYALAKVKISLHESREMQTHHSLRTSNQYQFDCPDVPGVPGNTSRETPVGFCSGQHDSVQEHR